MFSDTNPLCLCAWACIMWYLVVQLFDNENDWLLVARLLFHSVIGHFDWNSIKNKRSPSVAASQYFVWDCVDLWVIKQIIKQTVSPLSYSVLFYLSNKQGYKSMSCRPTRGRLRWSGAPNLLFVCLFFVFCTLNNMKLTVFIWIIAKVGILT